MLADVDSIENFLLARIAEDESAVAALAEPLRGRILATFEAIRGAIAMRMSALEGHPGFVEVAQYDVALWDMLTVLALPYADHPDYWAEYRPRGRAVVVPHSNRTPTMRPLADRIAREEPEQQGYLEVAVALARAVARNDPTTPREWIGTSIGVIGTAWSAEQSTEMILSRALLAMTRLAVAEAELIARAETGNEISRTDVYTVLASIPTRLSKPDAGGLPDQVTSPSSGT